MIEISTRHKILDQLVFDRAKGRCEDCGTERGAIHPATGAVIVLSVVRIQESLTGGSPDRELKALCQVCRSDQERKHREQQKEEAVKVSRMQLNFFDQ